MRNEKRTRVVLDASPSWSTRPPTPNHTKAQQDAQDRKYPTTHNDHSDTAAPWATRASECVPRAYLRPLAPRRCRFHMPRPDPPIMPATHHRHAVYNTLLEYVGLLCPYRITHRSLANILPFSHTSARSGAYQQLLTRLLLSPSVSSAHSATRKSRLVSTHDL